MRPEPLKYIVNRSCNILRLESFVWVGKQHLAPLAPALEPLPLLFVVSKLPLPGITVRLLDLRIRLRRRTPCAENGGKLLVALDAQPDLFKLFFGTATPVPQPHQPMKSYHPMFMAGCFAERLQQPQTVMSGEISDKAAMVGSYEE
jgi:hypothetical protein